MDGQTGEDLRLGSDLQTVVERPAGIEDLFHDFAKLIDLDRKHAAIRTPIAVLGDRTVERAVEDFDAVAQQILKSNQDRSPEIERLRLAKGVDDRNGDPVFLKRCDRQITAGVDAEVSGPPAIDHV